MTRHIRRDGSEESVPAQPVVDPAHARQQPAETAAPTAGATRQPEVRDERVEDHSLSGHEAAHEKFGGMNLGAVFFGWLVAVGVTILLTAIVGAIAAGIGADWTERDATREASTLGLAAGIVFLVLLFLGYYCGGYVAGRMSRFDGARQGIGVWVLGLLIAILAVVLGAIFGNEYNIFNRFGDDLPSIPLSGEEVSWGGVIAGVAALVVTLVAAILGGILGHRYHNRVDRVVRR